MFFVPLPLRIVTPQTLPTFTGILKDTVKVGAELCPGSTKSLVRPEICADVSSYTVSDWLTLLYASTLLLLQRMPVPNDRIRQINPIVTLQNLVLTKPEFNSTYLRTSNILS